MPGCPIPSHHIIQVGARVPGLYRKAAHCMYNNLKLRLVWDTSAVPTDFSAALVDGLQASRLGRLRDNVMHRGSGLLRFFELGVQHSTASTMRVCCWRCGASASLALTTPNPAPLQRLRMRS